MSDMKCDIQWPVELFVIDLETTGLKSKKHGILDAAIVHLASGAHEMWMVDPRPCEAEPQALVVNGLTCANFECKDRIFGAHFLMDLMRWIRDRLPEGRAVVVGRNPQFDLRMLRKAAKRHLGGMERALFLSTFHHRTLDTHGAIMALAIGRRRPVNVERIDDLYQQIGLEREMKPHTALRGALHCAAGLQLIVDDIAKQASLG